MLCIESTFCAFLLEASTLRISSKPCLSPNRLEFFNDLYHRFLLSPKPSMKAMCLQAMAIVYGLYYEEIGSFHDTEFVVRKLEQVCLNVTVPVEYCIVVSFARRKSVQLVHTVKISKTETNI